MRGRTIQYITVQYRYSTVQNRYSTVQYRHSRVQYSTVQYSAVQYSSVLYSTLQYSTVPLPVPKNPDGLQWETNQREPAVPQWYEVFIVIYNIHCTSGVHCITQSTLYFRCTMYYTEYTVLQVYNVLHRVHCTKCVNWITSVHCTTQLGRVHTELHSTECHYILYLYLSVRG